MRIRASCDACGRDFLFFELRHVDGRDANRCPNCHQLLGVRGLLAVRAEQALAVLVESLDDLARHDPNFTVNTGSVLRPVEEAVAGLAAQPAVDLDEEARRKGWWKGRRAAA